MKLIISLTLMLFLWPVVSISQTKSEFYINIISTRGDNYHKINVEKGKKLLLKKVGSRSFKKVKTQINSDDFVNIGKIFKQDVIDEIAANLSSSLHFCKSDLISLKYLHKGQSIIGDASLVYQEKHVSISPGNKYVIIKSSLGPFFLFDIESLKFENFCVFNGIDIEWIDNDKLAISYLDVLTPIYRNEKADTILIYEILSRKVDYLKYEKSQVQGFIWLENTKLIAVSLSQNIEHSSSFDTLLRRVGHPVEYQSFSLDLVDVKTGTHKTRMLKKKVANGYSFLYKPKANLKEER